MVSSYGTGKVDSPSQCFFTVVPKLSLTRTQTWIHDRDTRVHSRDSCDSKSQEQIVTPTGTTEGGSASFLLLLSPFDEISCVRTPASVVSFGVGDVGDVPRDRQSVVSHQRPPRLHLHGLHRAHPSHRPETCRGHLRCTTPSDPATPGTGSHRNPVRVPSTSWDVQQHTFGEIEYARKPTLIYSK